MAPYEALYGRKCRTPVCWTELSENKMIGPEIVKDTEEKIQIIRQRLKAASDRQKSYADLKRKDIEFQVGDKVFLKVSPWKHILRFGKKEIQVQQDLSYEERPISIQAKEVKQLRNKSVSLVKVLWQHHGIEEATWEPEEIMKAQYPQLFESGMNFEDKISKGGKSCNAPN
ncbi:hypothetical protein K2173_024229 [Erythroxylum novogranatense]|uniref:Reverse transcriptase n=1 Tax=Erythroxylum novogranatense TaxID=1862640 RepID=A0AAV8UGC5_9ROSI|nr:hypothetical protein K2173_024229 [Erythroxylum novogranatense]